jgi:transcriptional regulator with XRE-family HTH domain
MTMLEYPGEGTGMNGDQARMARQALGLSLGEAAKLCGVGVTTLQRLESGNGPTFTGMGVLKQTTLQKIQAAFEREGVAFLDNGPLPYGAGRGPSVRLKKPRAPR